MGITGGLQMPEQKHLWLGRTYGHAKEAKENAKQDEQQRIKAGQGATNRILHQNDVLTGTWSAARALQTTLGDEKYLRPITQRDLEVFKRNIETVKKRATFEKGITAKQIIDWSAKPFFGSRDNKSDLQLAMEQINHAVPVSAYNGAVRFITNASKDSDVNRHHVYIIFQRFKNITGSQKTSRQIALDIRKGPLSIDCDCGKQRFWYRYIATIGGFNSGRAETGLPKIRNPTLTNVACKHIVKVASEIQNGNSVLNFLIKMVDKSRANDLANVQHIAKQAETERELSNQKRRKSNTIKTSEQKKLEAAVRSAGKPKKVKRSARIGNTPDEREATLRAALAPLGLQPTQDQINQVRANVK